MYLYVDMYVYIYTYTVVYTCCGPGAATAQELPSLRRACKVHMERLNSELQAPGSRETVSTGST